MAEGETNGASASFEVLSNASGGDFGVFLAVGRELGDRSGGEVADDALALPSGVMLFARFCNVRSSACRVLMAGPAWACFSRKVFVSGRDLLVYRLCLNARSREQALRNKPWLVLRGRHEELQRTGSASDRVCRDACGNAIARGTLSADACLTLGPMCLAISASHDTVGQKKKRCGPFPVRRPTDVAPTRAGRVFSGCSRDAQRSVRVQNQNTWTEMTGITAIRIKTTSAATAQAPIHLVLPR